MGSFMACWPACFLAEDISLSPVGITTGLALYTLRPSFMPPHSSIYCRCSFFLIGLLLIPSSTFLIFPTNNKTPRTLSFFPPRAWSSEAFKFTDLSLLWLAVFFSWLLCWGLVCTVCIFLSIVSDKLFKKKLLDKKPRDKTSSYCLFIRFFNICKGSSRLMYDTVLIVTSAWYHAIL
jgi:putative exporter of polyketide antibiotics